MPRSETTRHPAALAISAVRSLDAPSTTITSAGAAAHIPIARATNLNRSLRSYSDAGLSLIGLDGRAAMSISDVPGLEGPLVLVVGSEAAGLSRLVREACDSLASIQISKSVESLNAGVAAGIALYELSRHRVVGLD